MAPVHTYIETDEQSAIETIREPIVRYVGYLRDSVASDSWSDDYAGYQGLVQKVEALMDFDVMYAGRSLFGDPAHARECLDELLETGVNEISLVTQMPGLQHEKILDSLRLFASDVMPQRAYPHR